MPREAARLGAAAEVAALDDVGTAVLRAFAARAGSGP
jgi:chemotaxis response regulator CheB